LDDAREISDYPGGWTTTCMELSGSGIRLRWYRISGRNCERAWSVARRGACRVQAVGVDTAGHDRRGLVEFLAAFSSAGRTLRRQAAKP